MKTTYIKAIYILSAAITATVCVLTLTSVWFIWDLLPKDADLALSIHARGLQPLIAIAKQYESDNKLMQSIEPYLTIGKRIAYAKKGENEFIILSPSWYRLGQSRELLNEKGWHQVQWATIIFATKGQNNSEFTDKNHLSSTLRALLMPWKQIFISKQPLQPVGVLKANPNTLPGLTTNISLIGSYKKDGMYITANLGSSEKVATKFPKLSQEERDKLNVEMLNGNLLALPIELLAKIPTNQKNRIIISTLEEIGFKTTATKTLKEVSRLDYIIIKTSSENIALGTKSNANLFIKEAQSWVEREESYYYPQKRSFKLPDGTLGAELRPSKPNVAWVNTGENCAYFAGKERTWWICNEKEKAAMGTSKEVVQDSIGAVNENYFQLQLAQLKQEQSSIPLKSLSAFGTKEKISIFIKLDN